MILLIRGILNDNAIRQISLDETLINSFGELEKFIVKTYYNCKDSTIELVFSNNGKNYKPIEKIDSQLKTKIFDVKTLSRGGKGGFGSLLKGQPAVKKRTNNFDSCRDLAGRRIRHVNQEKMLRDWHLKKMEEERLLKALNNPKDENNLKEYIDNDNKKSVNKLNKKFVEETTETTNSISESIRFLLKKTKRQNEEEKENYDYNDKNINKSTNNNFNNKWVEDNDFKYLTNFELSDFNKEKLEEELFSLDI